MTFDFRVTADGKRFVVRCPAPQISEEDGPYIAGYDEGLVRYSWPKYVADVALTLRRHLVSRSIGTQPHEETN